MRVALAHPTYWPEVRRGAERLVHDLAGGLHGAGHDVRIVTSAPIRAPSGTVLPRGGGGWPDQARSTSATPGAARPGRTVEDGVTVLRLPRPPGGDRLERRRFEPHVQLAPLTYAALRTGGDDAVLAFQAADAAVAARLTRTRGTPSVYAHMGIPHRAWLTSRRDRLRLVEQAVRGCSAVTALSEHARDAWWHWLGVEARVIAPPVDVVRFTPGGERSEHPTVVCAADATEPRKRVGLLVDAMALVRRVEPRARLLLDARTAHAAEGVELVEMTDLPALYRQAWVSALPSWGEAFGLVLAEALACGTPVVGADREGIPAVTGGDDRIGRLFAGDDPQAVADALLGAFELAGDPATAAACRARAETFGLPACVAAHEALLAELRGG